MISEVNKLKISGEAKDIADKFVQSHQYFFNKNVYNSVHRFCYGISEHDNTKICVKYKNNEETSPFTKNERTLLFCDNEGFIYFHLKIKLLLDIQTFFR